jgi:ferredoxin-NADP reductase
MTVIDVDSARSEGLGLRRGIAPAVVAPRDGGESELRLTVCDRRAAGDDVVVLDLCAADGGLLPAWTPGAHADILLPNGPRQYSLCSRPDDRTTWRIAVLREEHGRGGSRYIHERVRTGDDLRARGPRNHFPLNPAPRYHFVAGGIGITPLVPMMAQATSNGVDWHLTYGGRSRESMAFADELAEAYPGQVTLHPQDRQGLLDLDGLLRGLAPTTEVYACGPSGLLNALTERFVDRPGKLHVERFSAVPVARSTTTSFEVELASSGRVLTVPPGESLLDVLLDNDVAVDSSCEEGTCGSCETVVLAGEVEHRDAILDPAACGSLMVCVSRAASTCPRLVLDL